MLPASIVLGNVALALDDAAEDTATERRVGHVRDAELARRGHRLFRGVPVQQRVLALHRAEPMDGMGAPNRGRRGFRETEVAYLAALDEPGHGPDRVLDRHLGIDAVLVVEVDDVDTEPFEACVTRASHLGRRAIYRLRSIRSAHVAELRRQHHALA